MARDHYENAEPRLVKRYVPGLRLITDYEASWWRPDILAALSLWAVLIPQTMAYAQRCDN
jgi:MFS superfamily sulfate permease-like transporter